MQPNRVVQGNGIDGYAIVQRSWAMPGELPLLVRFLGKFVLDILPAALASVIGGFLFTQYQFGHELAPRPALEQVTPASAEMMALVRDEHAMILDYLRTQAAAEKSRAAAADADLARAEDARLADAETVDAKATAEPQTHSQTHHVVAASAAAKATAPRAKKPVTVATAATSAPLVIAQAEPNDGATAAADDRIARDPDSLLAKTLDLKDHVVAATRHVVSVIGDAFASVGEHIGGSAPSAEPVARQFSSAS